MIWFHIFLLDQQIPRIQNLFFLKRIYFLTEYDITNRTLFLYVCVSDTVYLCFSFHLFNYLFCYFQKNTKSWSTDYSLLSRALSYQTPCSYWTRVFLWVSWDVVFLKWMLSAIYCKKGKWVSKYLFL